METTAGLFRLDLIGPFGLFAPDGQRIEITSKKGIALIALLALAPNGIRTRNWLQGILWGSRSREQAQGSLRRELATLVTVLAQHDASHLLKREQSRIMLDLNTIDVDALTLTIGLAGRKPTAKADLLEGIDLLDCEAFEDWLRDQRTRIDQLQSIYLPMAVPTPSARDVIGAPLPPTHDLLERIRPPLPLKPSVSVIPFRNLSSDNDGQWLGSVVADEIGLTLARFPSLFVVATDSAAALLQRNYTHPEIAQELGVRYLIDGTIRLNDQRVRTAVRLIEGETGQQIWSCGFDGSSDDLFGLQERIVAEVAPRIHTEIDLRQLRAGLSNPLRDASSNALYWRANALFRQWDEASNREAIEICEQLVEADPTSAWASGMAAFCYGIAYASGWTPDADATKRAAAAHYQTALQHCGDDPSVLGYAAGTLVSIGGDMAVADRLISRALTLLPAYQPTLFWGGWVDIATGNSRRARDRFELSLRINPAAGVRAYAITGIGIALLMEGNVPQAYAMLADAVQYIPSYPLTLAALSIAAAMAGEHDVARRNAEALKRFGGAARVLNILQNPEHRAALMLGLEMAEGSV